MSDGQKNPTEPRNLSIRESVLTSIGPQCGRCGFKDHLAPLVIRAEGLSQNRKTTNYSQYWLGVLGLSMANPRAIEIICRNCLAIEQEEQRTNNPKTSVETIYIYSTDLLYDQINKRQQWLDSLAEPKKVYIIDGNNAVWRYKGNNKKGSTWTIEPVVQNATDKAFKEIIGDLYLVPAIINNGLFRIVNGKLEPVV